MCCGARYLGRLNSLIDGTWKESTLLPGYVRFQLYVKIGRHGVVDGGHQKFASGVTKSRYDIDYLL